jgi:thiamine biosynthesis lipoprotein
MDTNKKMNSALTRRNILKIIAVAGITASFWSLGSGRQQARQHFARRSRSIMGTTLNLIVISPDRDSAETAVDKTIDRMLQLENIFTRFQTNSALSQLNQTGRLKNAVPEFLELLSLALSISKKSNGAFDVTVLPLLKLHQQAISQNRIPDRNTAETLLHLVDYRKITIHQNTVSFSSPGMGITFDGIGKGYIVDQGVTVLKEYGFDNVFVEAGGDLMAAGCKTGKKPWRIGLKNPRPSDSIPMKVIEVTNRAVASSGDYMQFYSQDMRHHHIINPHTGFSPPELAACTITAPTVAMADGLATAAMVLGPQEAFSFLQQFPGCEGYFMNKNQQESHTTGFFA